MAHAVVIGGGIAGLSAAYYLGRSALAARGELRITILEASPEWGGKIRSERRDGFVIEGGPDAFLATKPWGVALCRELGLEGRLQGTNPRLRNTYVLRRSRLHALPDGLAMMIPTRLGPMARSGLLSWREKARMGMELFLPPLPPDGDESLGAFISRRLGRAAYENLIEPLMSGIYAGDGDRLSLLATFPQLRSLEQQHGGLIRGAAAMRAQIARATAGNVGNRSVFLSLEMGLAEIVEALLRELRASGADLRAGAQAVRVSRLEGGRGGLQVELRGGERLEAGAVVLAAPAFAAGELLKESDAGLGAMLEAIPYISTATVSLAYREADLPRPLNGYGYVIPRREGRKALACTWTSSKFPHRAPPGFALLRVFLGREGQEEQLSWDEQDLCELAQDELRQTLHLRARPVLARAFPWPRAMPQYHLGHLERLSGIRRRLASWPGLELAGAGYEGIGIPDCIRSGQAAAETILELLQRSAGRLTGVLPAGARRGGWPPR